MTLVRGNLHAIAQARRLSRAVMRSIRQNLFFAFIYNALGIPIAAGVFYPVVGLLLNPMSAAAAVSAFWLRDDQPVETKLFREERGITLR